MTEEDLRLKLLGFVDECRRAEIPPDITGDSAPRIAWRQGYIAALERLLDLIFDQQPPSEKGGRA